MKQKPHWFYRQSGTIPFIRFGTAVHVYVVSSRKGTRWIFPKGIVEPGLTSIASAEKETYEEAGLVGTLWPEPVGAYQYRKWGGWCSVEVFAMEVKDALHHWPEDSFRGRALLDLREAQRAIQDHGLIDVFSMFIDRLEKDTPP